MGEQEVRGRMGECLGRREGVSGGGGKSSCRVTTQALRLQSCRDKQEGRGAHTKRESQSIHVVHFTQVSGWSDVNNLGRL